MNKESKLSKLAGNVVVGIASVFIFLPIFLAFYACVVLPIPIIGWQIYSYLKTGEWLPISMLDGLAWLGLDWARIPNQPNWVGLHEILTFMPLSIGLWLVALISLIIWAIVDPAN